MFFKKIKIFFNIKLDKRSFLLYSKSKVTNNIFVLEKDLKFFSVKTRQRFIFVV